MIATIPAPASHPQALVWDGANLRVAGGNIYGVDPETGTVLGQIPGPAGQVQDLAWDGASIWCVSYEPDRIHRLDPSSGSVLSLFATPGSSPVGLAWDGTDLWHSDNDGTFYRVDPSDGSVVSSAPSPFRAGTTMLDWDGEHLWASKLSDKIYQIDTSWHTLNTIHPPAAGPKGIAWDGKNLCNGGWQDDQLCLLDATPAGASFGELILSNTAPVTGKGVDSFPDLARPAVTRLIR